MPDSQGRIRGITTHGLKNKWLDAVQMAKDRDRELERDREAFEELCENPKEAP